MFIFTEMIRCGEIGRYAISSFRKYHPNLTVNVFLARDDVKYIQRHDNVILHIIEEEDPIYKGFDNGHIGTSMLWQRIFMERPNEKLVHFDSDVLFCGNIIDDILTELETADLVGSCRPYKHNPNKMDNVRQYSDVVQTYCVGINTAKITVRDPHILQLMVVGYHWKHPTIDFFDPVSFHILENGGKIKYIDIDDIGGVTLEGTRQNKHIDAGNAHFDVGNKIIHFAGVGSGKNFYRMRHEQNKHINVPEFYVQFGLSQYDTYSRIMFNKKIIDGPGSPVVDIIRKRLYEPIHAMYINLEERTDRNTLIQHTLNTIKCASVTRIDAIKDRNGAIGVAHSQIKSLELAKERGLPCVLIVEDDLEWVSDKVNDAIDSLAHMDYDVCVLAPVFDLNCASSRVNEYFVSNTKCQTAAAYVCSNHYYQRLIDTFKESIVKLKAGENPDICAIDQHWKHLQLRDNWLFAYPTLGKQRPGFSNIQNAETNYDIPYTRNIQVS
jgi:hypothetical protein